MRTLNWNFLLAPLVYGAIGLVIGVFAWSALRGDKGLVAQAEARAQEARLTLELAEARAARATAENRVRRLGSEHLDLDLLDERARTVLGLARADEIVVKPVAR